MATIKLGELLIKAKVLNETQVRAALAEQKKWGGRLGDVLVRMNLLTEELLVRALAKQLSIPAVNLDAIESVPQLVRERIPAKMARDLNVVPLQIKDENRTLVIAMSEPQNLDVLDKVRAVCNCRVAPHVAARSAIERAVTRFYGTDAALGVTLTPGPAVPPRRAPAYPEDLPEAGTGSFKILDAQGQTKIGKIDEVDASGSISSIATLVPPARATQPVGARDTLPDALSLLSQFESTQKREVASVKAIVELLIEKGYFTREEYLAKMRR